MIKHLQKIILAAAMLFFAHSGWAYDFSAVSNGTTFFYNITSNTAPYTIEVTFIGISNIYSGNVTIPSSVTYNGITYSVTSIGREAFYGCSGLTSITIPNTVTSIGRDAFYGCTGLASTNYTGTIAQWCDIDFSANPITYSNNLYINNQLVTNLVIPNTVDTIKPNAFCGDTCIISVTISNSVTSIGNYAFSGCKGLTSVTIGNSVKSIGEDAFRGCTGLTRTNYTGTIAQWCDIDFDFFGLDEYSNPISCSHNLYINNQLVTNLVIPNTVDTIKHCAFWGDTCITSVTIPNSVTNIGASAFNGCTGLTSITIPNSVTRIGSSAFYNCTGLTRTNYTGTIAQWCDIDFMHNPISYSRNLYINNQLITNLVIPNTVNTIKQYAFGGDTCITSITIGDSVTSIGECAFSGCKGLTSVTIPNSVTSIGDYTFYYCTGLTSVTIGNSVKSIEEDAFGNDTNLTTVNFNADSCVYMGTSSSPVFYNCNNLRTLNIGNNVRIIPRYAFYNCSVLPLVTIPNSVTIIGYGAFYSCTGLTSVTIPNSVTSIGVSAFGNCSGLTSVTIPNSVTSIGNYSFSGCSGLTSVTFHRANTTIGTDAFSGVTTSIPIYMPCNSLGWYVNKMPNFNNFIEVLQYSYSVTSQDTVKGTVATVTAPTCNSSSWTILATANTGYTFSRWSDGDTNTQRTLTVNRDTTLIAYFVSVQPWYTFSVVSEDTTKGAVHIITQPTQANPQATFVALPNNGYTFSRWSDGNTQNPRTLTVTQDTTLVAYFTANTPQWYRFSVVSEDTLKGTVQIITQPSQSNPQATFVALPNTGYTFSRWSDGNTQNPRTLTVTHDTALVAYFTANTPQWYRFSVVSEDTLKGTVQIITQPSQANPQATFVALPNTGYTFSRWSDGNTQNPRTLTVTQDTVLVACFTSSSQQWYNFNVVSEDVNKGTVQVLAQPSQSNPQATFVALPNTGYTFSRWSDGNTQNPRSITVTQDTILIAFFTSTQGIAEAENASIKLYPNPASDKVTLEGIGNEADIFIISAMGKVVRRLENAGGTITFSVGDLPKGIYFVRVGNAVRKMVVE